MLAATSNTCTASSDKDNSAGVGPGDPIIYAIGAAPQEVVMAAFAPSVAQPSFMMLQCPAGAGCAARYRTCVCVSVQRWGNYLLSNAR